MYICIMLCQVSLMCTYTLNDFNSMKTVCELLITGHIRNSLSLSLSLFLSLSLINLSLTLQALSGL